MKNLYEKYWVINEKDWHEYKTGTYHVSAIGVSHQDLEPEEHSGPCLRDKYFVYLEGENHSIETQGNFGLGNLLHAEGQEIYKKNNPNSVSEFPLVYNIDNNGEPLEIRGSVDIIDFNIQANPDLKTASLFTFPKSEYEVSPTYEAQVTIYTHILAEFVFRPSWYLPNFIRIISIKKHNLYTIEQDKEITDAKKTYDEFIERVQYLDDCLKKREVPDAEPMKWCKYCHKLEYCLEKGDVIKVKDGRKTRYLKND